MRKIVSREYMSILLVLGMMLVTSVQAQEECPPPPDGLVSWWPGEDDVLDIVNSNHGVLVNGTLFVPGLVNRAFSFDGFDDYVNIPHADSIFFGDFEPFTMEAWFRAESETPSFFILKNAGYGVRWQGSSNSMAFYNGNYHFSSKTSWHLGRWYHVALVDDGVNSVKLYIDGILDKSDDGLLRSPNRFPCHPAGYCFELQFGGYYETQNVEYFKGQVDEVTLYDRALTATEIQTIFAAGSQGKCDPLDQDGDGFQPPADCNDANPAIHPGASERCDGYDDNCNGILDDSCDGTCDSPSSTGADLLLPLQYSNKAYWSTVWTGTDLGIAYLDNYFGSWDVWFARIDASGHLVANSRVTTEYGLESYPTIAWTGSEFGIAWHDERNSTQVQNSEIYFVRVSPGGERLSSDIRVSDSQLSSTFPALVWNGTEYGLIWQDARDAFTKIYFTALDRQGNKRFPEHPITARVTAGQPRLVWNGTHYAMAWWDSYADSDLEIYFGQFDGEGNRIGSDVRVTNIPGESGGPSLVWNGNGYGIAWYDERFSPSNQEIFFASLGPDGTKLAEDVRITDSSANQYSPFLVWTGIEYALAWSDERNPAQHPYHPDLYVTRKRSRNGVLPLDPRIGYK